MMLKKTIITSIFILLIVTTSNAQCVKGGQQSKFSPNPENKLNGDFKFDYQIYSTIEYKSEGKIKRLNTHYYVNSQDGSLFFPEGIFGMNNFNNDDNHFRFDGAVRLANKQMGIYLYDKEYQKKRVFTVASDESASDNFLNTHLALLSFFNDRSDPEINQEIPEPLPSGFDWDGITHGFTGYIYNNDSRAKLTIYLDEQPNLSYKTSVPLAGFLSGILNYLDAQKCNALIVFSKLEMENGDYIQEELYSINPEQKYFNGSPYKPFGLTNEMTNGSRTDTQNMQAKMAEFQSKALELGNKINQLQKEKQRCLKTEKGGSHYCAEHYDPLIKKAKEEADQLQYQIMKSMGVEDMIDKK